MKFALLISIFFYLNIKAQVFIIDEQFNSGTVPAAGWIFSGAITSSSGSGNFGRNAPNITLGATGTITYSWTGGLNNPDQLTFIYRGQGSSANCGASTIIVQQSINGITWTAVSGTVLMLQSTLTSSFSGNLNSSTRYIRISFTQVGTATVYIDDFKVRKSGNCISNPIIKMILIDGGCSPGCEGGNEFVIAQNGNSSLAIDNLELAIQSQGGVAPKGTTIGGNATNTTAFWTKNSTYNASQLAYISALTGTCTVGTFIPVSATNIIPANSNMLLITGSAPTHTYNFNSACSSGPFYVVFSNLDCVGKFSNSGCTQCFRTISLMNNGTGCADTKTYTSVSSAASGVSIVFNPSTSAPTQTTTSCSNFSILPIQLIDFYATKNKSQNDIVWKVAQEENIQNYILEKSEDGTNFTELITISTNNESQIKTYTAIDDAPFNEITYYRLKTKENNGSIVTHKIISIDGNSKDWSYTHYQQANNLVLEFKNTVPKNASAEIFDLSGKQLLSSTINKTQTLINTENLSNGIYFVRLSAAYKTEHFKILISN